jgi:GT2 family glycosyltransferase
MTQPAHVTVYTMTYNQRQKVLRLAEDLAAQDYPAGHLELVALDDGSTDGTSDALEDVQRALPYTLKVLRRAHQGDYLSALRWNECVATASAGSTVLIQVDDVRVRPDFVARHVTWHAGPDLVLVTGAKFEGDAETWDLNSCRRAHLAGSDGRSARTEHWTAVWGSSLSYSRRLLDILTVGEFDRPFDTRMSGWGFQEVEFAFRAAQAGARLVYDPAVGVFHQNHTPVHDQGRGIDHAVEKARGEQRNQSYVLAKHGLARMPRW